MRNIPKSYHEYYLKVQDTDNRKSKAVLSAYAKYRRETLLGRIADRFNRLIDIISKRN